MKDKRESAPSLYLSILTQIYEQLNYCRTAIAAAKCCQVASSWQRRGSLLYDMYVDLPLKTWLITQCGWTAAACAVLYIPSTDTHAKTNILILFQK